MSRPSPIAAARARHTLAEVAARTGINIYRAGGSVSVRCPFPSHGHPDRTPSLRLHLADGIFCCFGCGAKGDVVEWVRQSEGVDWREAIAVLDAGRPLANTWAGRATSGYEPSPGVPAGAAAGAERAGRADAADLARTPPERVYAAVAAAWDYYTRPPRRGRGEEYLWGRGIDVKVIEAHNGRPEVGHTPANADGLVAFLHAQNFSEDELVDAALAHRRVGGGPLSDFYRQRVLVPIRDDQERVVGIIGRNVGDQQRWAKYKNPPRTAIYDKSVNLYQPLTAPADPRGQVIVVEGTLDAMAIAVAAIRTGHADRFCPVTQSGRELSAAQLARVTQMHSAQAVLGFDGDAAGQDAAYRHALAALRLGSTTAVTVLPDDHDPASWLAERGDDGLAAWTLDATFSLDSHKPRPIPADVYVALQSTTSTARSGSKRPVEHRRSELGANTTMVDSLADDARVAL